MTSRKEAQNTQKQNLFLASLVAFAANGVLDSCAGPRQRRRP
jgi:hypothetical protein